MEIKFVKKSNPLRGRVNSKKLIEFIQKSLTPVKKK